MTTSKDAPVTGALSPELLSSPDATGFIAERFLINAPEDVVAVTHNGTNMINPTPSGIALFSEPVISNGLVLVAKLRNDKREIVGFAIESETIDGSTNQLVGKMRMNTEWTIVLPGRGSIFMAEIEDSGSVGKEILPTVMQGKEWKGSVDFTTTVGPDPSGRGVIVGGTREFEGITGTFVEGTHLSQMSQARGAIGTFDLQLIYKKR